MWIKLLFWQFPILKLNNNNNLNAILLQFEFWTNDNNNRYCKLLVMTMSVQFDGIKTSNYQLIWFYSIINYIKTQLSPLTVENIAVVISKL